MLELLCMCSVHYIITQTLGLQFFKFSMTKNMILTTLYNIVQSCQTIAMVLCRYKQTDFTVLVQQTAEWDRTASVNNNLFIVYQV